MARRCFEVSNLKFKLCYNGPKTFEKVKDVLQKVEEYLIKYASSTKIKNSHHEVYNGDVIIYIEFSKKISVNTVNKILSQMYADSNNKLHISYGEIKCEMTVSILR